MITKHEYIKAVRKCSIVKASPQKIKVFLCVIDDTDCYANNQKLNCR